MENTSLISKLFYFELIKIVFFARDKGEWFVDKIVQEKSSLMNSLKS